MKWNDVKAKFMEYRGYAENYGNVAVVKECDNILADKSKGYRKRIAFAFNQMQAAATIGADGGKNQLYNLDPMHLYQSGSAALDAWVVEQKALKALEADVDEE